MTKVQNPRPGPVAVHKIEIRDVVVASTFMLLGIVLAPAATWASLLLNAVPFNQVSIVVLGLAGVCLLAALAFAHHQGSTAVALAVFGLVLLLLGLLLQFLAGTSGFLYSYEHPPTSLA